MKRAIWRRVCRTVGHSYWHLLSEDNRYLLCLRCNTWRQNPYVVDAAYINARENMNGGS
jgi:hypothetical protein